MMNKDKPERTILVVLFGIALSLAIFFLVIIGMDCCIYLYKNYAPDYRKDTDFGRTLWLFYKYELIWILLFTNFFFSLCRRKTVVRVMKYIMYAVTTGLWWWYLLTCWPFRAVPVIAVLTACYILDLFVLNWFIKTTTTVKPKIL